MKSGKINFKKDSFLNIIKKDFFIKYFLFPLVFGLEFNKIEIFF
jgi:hypothetical protein